jgi:hypothetical protein
MLTTIHVPGRIATGTAQRDGLAAVRGSVSLGWRSLQMLGLF